MAGNVDEIIVKPVMFEWDTGNRDKNWRKHRVRRTEAEQVFFNEPILTVPDPKHAQHEKRYHCLGQTNHGRKLFISFTIRDKKIRVISARDQDRKERRVYEKAA